MHLRRWNNAVHRDLGYFLTGVAVLYAVSGLALNHADHWDPNFVVARRPVQAPPVQNASDIDRRWIARTLTPLDEDRHYRGHDFPTPDKLKIYLDEGSVSLDLADGRGTYESVRRRPVLFRINCLHVSPKTAWRVVSDLFAVGLIVVAVTGLFVMRGRRGITRRGAALAAVGLLIPLAFLLAVP